MLYVGRTTTDGTDEGFYLDASRSRAVFICGKRGSGKSYTLGVILEELALAGNVLVIVADPMGIFHTMRLPNEPQRQALWDWNLGATGVPVRLLPPGDPEARYGRDVLRVLRDRDVDVRSFRINPSDLSNEGWLELFSLDMAQPMGLILLRALQKSRARSAQHFFVPDIVSAVQNDPLSKEASAQALTLRLETAANEWDLFTTHYQDLSESFSTGMVNVLDLSVLDNSRFGLRNLVLSVLVRHLFARRRQARMQEELNLSPDVPRIWLAIDEAQEFVPSGKSTLSKEGLIQWVKEGRQPGLSLVVATQQPGAVDKELLSQCDLIISHKITAADDVDALNRLNQAYMGGREMRVMLRQLARTGEAVLIDDTAERATVLQVRPRKSRHGGGET